MSIDFKTESSEIEYLKKFSVGVDFRKSALAHCQNRRFQAAITDTLKCCSFSQYLGASTFKALCQSTCEFQDYKTAQAFQTFAKQYDPEAGNEAMSCIIKSQVAHLNFLEISGNLIESSLALVEEDREFGLQALMSIAKKFADLGLFEKAMEYTQSARTLRDTKMCSRGRNHAKDIYPFTEMGYHMLNLKEYVLAEECARKLDPTYFHPECLFADIIVKQIQEDNFINEDLLSELKPNTLSWLTAYEGLAFNLIDHKRYEESQVYAKKRLEVEWNFGKYEFQSKFNEKLKSLWCNPNTWLS